MADEEKPEPFYRLLWVKATDPKLCGVWDPHPQQPGGEAFVSGEAVVQVAATPIVLDALAKSRIVEVGGPSVAVPLPAEGSPAQPAIGGEAPADAAKKR